VDTVACNFNEDTCESASKKRFCKIIKREL
jgi:hypothetical protein